MAQALRFVYSDLFKAFLNPCNESLENYFRTATGRAGRALVATEATFKTLCKFADFETSSSIPTIPPIASTSEPQPKPTIPQIQVPMVGNEGGVNVTVNIRFELPITTNIDVYDKILESLKKHLLTPSSKSD